MNVEFGDFKAPIILLHCNDITRAHFIAFTFDLKDLKIGRIFRHIYRQKFLMSKSRGVFIVFEGLDRCGKTTQVNKTLDFFKKSSLSVEEFVFPDRKTSIGIQIDEFNKKKLKLNDQVIHLLYTANRWEKRFFHHIFFFTYPETILTSENILETLGKGTNIVCSRYSYSGVAYSSAKNGMNLKWCKNPEVGLPQPDLVIYLKIAKSGNLSERKGFGDEIYEKESFLNKVKDQYDIIIKDDLKMKDGSDWKIIDASQSIEEVWGEVSKMIKDVVKRNKEGKLGDIKSLWKNMY